MTAKTETRVTVMAYSAAPGRLAFGPYLVWKRPRESLRDAFTRQFPWTKAHTLVKQ